ncbi:MAG: AraC family transcriptional regulator [Lachnospiraceae bacterium]|nr:AraC family transcriptional regulator [Lachnospiraceae bacterium]
MKESNCITQYFHTPSKEFLNSSIYITMTSHQHCLGGESVGPRILDTYCIAFVVSGKGYLKSNGHKLETLNPGDLFVLFPKEKHHYYADAEDPWELMWILFNGTLAGTLLQDVGLTKDSYILSNMLTHSVQRTVQTIINALGDTADTNRLCAVGHFYVLFAYLKQITEASLQHSETIRQDSCVWKAIRFIEQNYYLDIDVDMLCDHVNYSRSYLSRTFRNETSMTIPEYINKIRVQNAIHLLKDSKMQVKEISVLVGMKDSFYFSKLFKKITGETPREYRKNHGQA